MSEGRQSEEGQSVNPTRLGRARVAVRASDSEQRAKARAILEQAPDAEVEDYDGLVEGFGSARTLAALAAAGFETEVTEIEAALVTGAATPPAVPASTVSKEPSAPLLGRSKRADPELRRIFDEFATRAEHTGSDDPSGAGDADVYRVWLKGPLRHAFREQLDRLGLRIISYRSSTYQMRLTPEQAATLRQLPFVSKVQSYDLLDTVTSGFLSALESAGAGERRTFDVVLHHGFDLALIRRFLENTPELELLEASNTTLRIRAEPHSGALAALANRVEVKTVAPFVAPRLGSDRMLELLGIATINEAPGRDGVPRWTGKGEVVGVLDSGIDSTHEDFAGRIRQAIGFRDCTAEDHYGHGTHVAGIIAGSGAAWGAGDARKLQGMAPEAELVVVGMTTQEGQLVLPVDLGELLERATQNGATILNLSWTSETNGAYDTGSTTVDNFVYQNPEVLVVVAAGNTGRAPEGSHQFGTVGAPASAKNVLTVGACATDRIEHQDLWGDRFQAAFPKPKAASERIAGDPQLPSAISGRGPTDFESVKPDLLAPGTYVLAPQAANAKRALFEFWGGSPHPKYGYLSGTSMAAPGVAGAAALLRQYLREELKTPRPSAALLKALLISAVRRLPLRPEDADIGYPDFHQGFGRLDLSTLLPHAQRPKQNLRFVDIRNDDPRALESRMPLDSPRKSQRRYRLELPEHAQGPLCIVLVWTDLPGPGIQNTLELQVRDPSGKATVGNPELVFRRDRFGDTGYGNGAPYDRRNNVQKIELVEPAPGAHGIAVLAWNTIGKAQGYALAVSAGFDFALEELE